MPPTFTVSDNALAIYKKRYLQPGETVEGLWRRVSFGFDDYYHLMAEGRFLPNSPTLFNAGLNNGCTLSACFTADTVIHTLEGDFTVSQLLTKDKEFEVFSTNGRRLKIGNAFALRKTKVNAKVYRVKFDSGDEIKLTADHLVMMRDASYKEVRHLKKGDSVMPFNHGRQKGRRYVFKKIDSGYTLAYQWAFREKMGRKAKENYEIHHVNLNKMDDRTSNLTELPESDHKRLHVEGDLNPMRRPEVAAKISEHMVGNKRGVGPKPGTSKAMMGNQHALKDVPHPDPRRQYQRIYARNRLRNQRAGKPKGEWNHRVVSVKYAGREDVYDLSVHKYHNFAANGVFIHNCFVFNVADDMLDSNRSIVETRKKAIAVAKAGGGVGYYFGELRPKGSPIKSVHRVACGPVTVLKDYQAISRLITQGGKRELAQMGILNCDHPDVREFIHVKDDCPQDFNSFNLSVSWSEKALQMVHGVHGIGTGFRELWDEQCQSAWKTGCPGMFFPDTTNRANPNPHLGLMLATNPCGETPNRDSEPCNLGSLSLPRYWSGQRGRSGIDWDRLAADAELATEFLDEILDHNVFPHPDITAAANLTRKLGLGVMGWADLLALLHIHYDTQEAVQLGEDLMREIDSSAHRASVRLAQKKGPYPGYSDKTNGPCRRNETCTSVAPTGTIAILADVFGSIEPHFSLEWERTTNEGMKLKERISCWDDLDGFVPKIASEIAPEWHVRHQAAFQKHTDLGVSKTVNLPNSATVEDVSKTYRLMWESGCKGGTIFRDGCRSEQVLVKKDSTSVYSTGVTLPVPDGRIKLPRKRPANIYKFRVNGVKGYLKVGLHGGLPAEIFVTVGKMGSTVDGMIDSWAIAFSFALQAGVPLEKLVAKYKGVRFEPNGLTGDPDVPVCTSIPDFVVRLLEVEFLKAKDSPPVDSGFFCPDCGAPVVFQAGCLTCLEKECGWSKCG